MGAEDNPTEVLEEYPHDCRIRREERQHEDLYHYEEPMGHVKSFRDPRQGEAVR